jgi:hypothetical protein
MQVIAAIAQVWVSYREPAGWSALLLANLALSAADDTTVEFLICNSNTKQGFLHDTC